MDVDELIALEASSDAALGGVGSVSSFTRPALEAICVLLDVSGSMANPAFPFEKDGLERVLQGVSGGEKGRRFAAPSVPAKPPTVVDLTGDKPTAPPSWAFMADQAKREKDAK